MVATPFQGLLLKKTDFLQTSYEDMSKMLTKGRGGQNTFQMPPIKIFFKGIL